MNDEKPDRIEIAFLCYKASMWDSLESIYLAAKNDPQCDAYVIAIPYYDRLPGGALGQMHCESGEYPAHIPMTDWREYNLQDRRPDVVFIMNPYDGNNYVTSVHPDYYSHRLKQHCKLLAYVPYFVTVDDTISPSLCLFPGVLNADVVFVESEALQKQYAAYFAAADQQYEWNGKFGTPDKIIASGSPKIEKAIHARREDYPLPPAWEKLLTKPDGSRKKAILYNTSLSSLLRGKGKYLEKLRHVLGVFKEREDVVLWWRPHPLSEATLRSMHPVMLDYYRRIVLDYQADGFGIYDDTAELYRAICQTDAYYGDFSSVIRLYMQQPKAVLIQDIRLLGEPPTPRPTREQDAATLPAYLYISSLLSETYDLSLEEFLRDFDSQPPANRGEATICAAGETIYQFVRNRILDRVRGEP